MSDLISRSALIEVIKKYKFGAISNDAEREYIKDTIIQFIDNQPTVYNVDAVVEQVHDELFTYDIPDDIVDDVVRKGGV